MTNSVHKLAGEHWYVGFESGGVLTIDTNVDGEPQGFLSYDTALAYAKAEQEITGTGRHFVFFNPTIIHHTQLCAYEHHYDVGEAIHYQNPERQL